MPPQSPRSPEDPLPPSMGAVIADLDAAERGFVVGALATGSAESPGALAGIAGERCAEALAAVKTLSRPERVRLMGFLAREALAPIPAGIENVHADTLRLALEQESDLTIQLVTANGPPVLQAAGMAILAARIALVPPVANRQGTTQVPVLAPDVIADLQRAVLVSIVSVPPIPTANAAKRWARRLLTLTPSALLTEVTAAGADILGQSLRGAELATLKRAAAHAGSPWSERILAAAHTTVERIHGDGDGHVDDNGTRRAWARALVAATTPAETPRKTLDRLGARFIGDRLRREDPDSTVAFAQRLPPDLARELLAAAAF